MKGKIIIHNEYEFDSDKCIAKGIKDMEKCSIEELRLWIIQELSTVDSECWWLIDIGIKILKDKMNANGGLDD